MMTHVPDPASVRARIRAEIAKMTKRERQRIARLIGHDPSPDRDREGLAAQSDDGATPELRQHADVAERHLKTTGGKRGHQRLTRMERLKLDGDAAETDPATGRLSEGISRSEYHAGERHHDDWAVGVCGVRERSLVTVQGGVTPGGPTDAQLAALARWQAARVALGPVGAELMLWCACEDRPWAWIARKLGEDDTMAKAKACAAFAVLATHYAERDRRR